MYYMEQPNKLPGRRKEDPESQSFRLNENTQENYIHAELIPRVNASLITNKHQAKHREFQVDT